jgi:hypothetical protein
MDSISRDFRLCLGWCPVLAETHGTVFKCISIIDADVVQSPGEGVDRKFYIQLVITGLRTSNLNISKLKDLTDGVHSEQI